MNPGYTLFVVVFLVIMLVAHIMGGFVEKVRLRREQLEALARYYKQFENRQLREMRSRFESKLIHETLADEQEQVLEARLEAINLVLQSRKREVLQ